jgi:hypothetical protein
MLPLPTFIKGAVLCPVFFSSVFGLSFGSLIILYLIHTKRCSMFDYVY